MLGRRHAIATAGAVGPTGGIPLSWQVPWWFSLLVRVAVAAGTASVLYLLLRREASIANVGLAVSALFALGALMLVDLEGATRVTFLNLEIDRRLESATEILERLERLDERSRRTASDLAAVQRHAQEAANRLSEVVVRQEPRALSEAQRAALLEALRDAPTGPIWMATPAGDPESRAFALQIRGALEDAGFPFFLPLEETSSEHPRGLILRISPGLPRPPHATAIAQAFEAAGLAPSVEVTAFVGSGDLHIVVGHKP